MNILDENIPLPEPEKLRQYKIAFKQIGVDLAEKGILDEDELRRLLHRLKEPTFFTRDAGFFREEWLHSNCCLVVLTVDAHETADAIRRFLKHAEFDTVAKRMGKVIRCGTDVISVFEKGQKRRSVQWQ